MDSEIYDTRNIRELTKDEVHEILNSGVNKSIELICWNGNPVKLRFCVDEGEVTFCSKEHVMGFVYNKENKPFMVQRHNDITGTYYICFEHAGILKSDCDKPLNEYQQKLDLAITDLSFDEVNMFVQRICGCLNDYTLFFGRYKDLLYVEHRHIHADSSKIFNTYLFIGGKNKYTFSYVSLGNYNTCKYTFEEFKEELLNWD